MLLHYYNFRVIWRYKNIISNKEVELSLIKINRLPFLYFLPPKLHLLALMSLLLSS